MVAYLCAEILNSSKTEGTTYHAMDNTGGKMMLTKYIRKILTVLFHYLKIKNRQTKQFIFKERYYKEKKEKSFNTIQDSGGGMVWKGMWFGPYRGFQGIGNILLLNRNLDWVVVTVLFFKL